jgi:hypothetical protein
MVITNKRLAMAALIAISTSLLACSESMVAPDLRSEKAVPGSEGPGASDLVLAPMVSGLWLFEMQTSLVTHTPGEVGQHSEGGGQSSNAQQCIEKALALTRGGVVDNGLIDFAVKIPDSDIVAIIHLPVLRVAGEDHASIKIVQGDVRTAFVETTTRFTELDNLRIHRRTTATATRIGDCPVNTGSGGFGEQRRSPLY